jgi:hypothetical protein
MLPTLEVEAIHRAALPTPSQGKNTSKIVLLRKRRES